MHSARSSGIQRRRAQEFEGGRIFKLHLHPWQKKREGGEINAKQ